MNNAQFCDSVMKLAEYLRIMAASVDTVNLAMFESVVLALNTRTVIVSSR